MRTIGISIATSMLIGVGAMAQTYSLNTGWNLVGSYENGVSPTQFSFFAIR